MRTLIYKRTHSGDPDPVEGVFGCHNCMRSVRTRVFDAVIGIGGKRPWKGHTDIAEKLNWVGIGARKDWSTGVLPLVSFDHYLYYGENGPLLAEVAPLLASRFYTSSIRTLMDKLSADEQREVDALLALAISLPPSGAGSPQLWPQLT